MYALECIGARKYFVERDHDEAGEANVAANGAAAAGGAAMTPGPRRWLLALRPRTKLVKAVDDVTLTVERGEIFGILGPNGSGKSTLIRLIATLLLPDAGTIRIFGRDVVAERLAVRRMINRVSVEAAFFKKLSAMENLTYAARLYDVPVGAARRKVEEILAALGFGRQKLFSPLEDLSRGMQQKVAIARALLTAPVMLLLDEPTTGLDPKSKREVQEFVLNMRRTHDATIILTTHDMEEAGRMCDRIAIVHHGRIVALGTPEELKRSLARTTPVTLEDVFFELTGKDWEEAEANA